MVGSGFGQAARALLFVMVMYPLPSTPFLSFEIPAAGLLGSSPAKTRCVCPRMVSILRGSSQRRDSSRLPCFGSTRETDSVSDNDVSSQTEEGTKITRENAKDQPVLLDKPNRPSANPDDDNCEPEDDNARGQAAGVVKAK
eukprot:3789557-Rhodomonas_salina.2